ncbi:hypothetical protein [Caulobacter phage BL94]|nr:hypothetical protein [Caulobacter phage BL94]
MNGLTVIRERMRLTPKQLAYELDVDVETVRNQERASSPRKIYLLAAQRLEDQRADEDKRTLNELRSVIKRVADLAEKGVML